VSTSRVAIVTGGARGIGQAIALRLAQAGHVIALGDVRPADETVTAIRDAGGDAVAVGCDLGSAAGAELLAAEVTERFGCCERPGQLCRADALPAVRRA